jgi:hypothetical protein
MSVTDPYVKAKIQERHAQPCDNPDCRKMFVAKNKNQKSCSRRCTEIMWRKKQPGLLISAARVRAEDGLKDYNYKIKRPPEATVKRLEKTLPADILAICLEVRKATASHRIQTGAREAG